MPYMLASLVTVSVSALSFRWLSVIAIHLFTSPMIHNSDMGDIVPKILAAVLHRSGC